MHVLAAPKDQTNVHACFQFASKFKPHCMFFSCFELFTLVELQQTMGLPSLSPIFAGNASCTVVVYFLAQLFLFSHVKSYFLKNNTI